MFVAGRRVAVIGHSPFDDVFHVGLRSSKKAGFGVAPDHVFKFSAGHGQFLNHRMDVPVTVIAENQPVLGVEQSETGGDAFDGVDQIGLGAGSQGVANGGFIRRGGIFMGFRFRGLRRGLVFFGDIAHQTIHFPRSSTPVSPGPHRLIDRFRRWNSLFIGGLFRNAKLTPSVEFNPQFHMPFHGLRRLPRTCLSPNNLKPNNDIGRVSGYVGLCPKAWSFREKGTEEYGCMNFARKDKKLKGPTVY